MQVKKKDGTLEVFMPEKIVVSIVKSGASYEIAREIAASVSNRSDNVIESSAIREIVLSELTSRGQRDAVDHWHSYEQQRRTI